jgi:cytidylate kinase
MSVPVIAIDGPTASGKGTVAAKVAAALGFHLLESGALYRLVALASERADVGSDNEPQLARIAAAIDVRFAAGRVLLGGEDVTDDLRSEECGMRASAVAAHPFVRKALLARQRAFCQPPGLVADGRDMGTVVFPGALLKIFLTASIAARAGRRHKQLIEKGISANLAALSRDLAERDARDASRSVAPLMPASDAVLVDSSASSADEVAGIVIDLYRKNATKLQS